MSKTPWYYYCTIVVVVVVVVVVVAAAAATISLLLHLELSAHAVGYYCCSIFSCSFVRMYASRRSKWLIPQYNKIALSVHYVLCKLYCCMLCSSEADGGSECTLQTGGSITLSVATTSAPSSLQEHEILGRHHAAWRIGSRSVHETDTEFVGGQLIYSVARFSLGKVRKQRHVTGGICVTITELHAATVHLSDNRQTNTVNLSSLSFAL